MLRSAIAAFAALLPVGAQAAALCVAPGGESPTEFQSCDDGSFPSFAAALAAAAALPDEAGGGRPVVAITLLGGEEATAHAESLFVDNRVGLYGEPLSLFFGYRPMCPSPDATISSPVVEFATSGSDGIRELNLDLSATGPCPSEHSGVLVWGSGSVGVAEVEVVGWTGWGIASGVVGDPVGLNIINSSIRNGTGVAVRAGGSLSGERFEIAGNRLPGQSVAPGLIWMESTAPGLFLMHVLLFGNQVEGEKALLSGRIDLLANLVAVGNGLAPGGALVESGFSTATHAPGRIPPKNEARGLVSGVFSRNRFVDIPDAFELPDQPDAGFTSYLSEIACGDCSTCQQCCMSEWMDTPLLSRASPFADLAVIDDGSLVRVDPSLGFPSDGGGLLIAKNFFVDNEGADELITARLASSLSLQLMHNTFGGNGEVAVLQVEGGGDSSELIAVRNVHVGSAQRPIELADQIGRLFVSMNTTSSPEAWAELGTSPPDTSLVGPEIAAEAFGFRSPSAIESLTGCQATMLVCPDASADDCASEMGADPLMRRVIRAT